MFRYKINITKALKDAGYSTYRIRKESIFAQGTLTAFNNDGMVSFATLDKLCTLLNCDIGDIIEHVKEDK